ncbi:MAG: CaiB/BaiF CoA-transferase family protein [Ottowia sp.]|uniref:CaiB/BaiF CoA transferase family protein n=1 Tax=Ottowia sp. TaxID=1898956 RepID=UPI003C71A529
MTTKDRNALAGLTVLDASRLLPAALCTQMLGDLGADVLKVEEPGRGDYQRGFPPLGKADSGTFLLCNRNKRSMTLNLKHEEGKHIFRELAAQSDVLVEGFRPGVMDRLGLGYEALKAINPRLIYCAISGYGQDGPYKHLAGHDLNYLGVIGALPLFGKANEGPMVPGMLAADTGASLTGAWAILAAVLARQNTGLGQFIDVSMMDSAMAFLTYHAAEPLFGNVEPRGGEYRNTGGAPCYGIFRCADGHYVTLGALEEHFWTRFCDLAGVPHLKEDQFPEGEARERQFRVLEDLFRQRTRQEWVDLFFVHDIPGGPVNTMREAFDDPHMRARQMLLHIDHPVEGRIPQLGFPVKFSGTPARIDTPPPTLGQHTSAVLSTLGYDAARISELTRNGTI